MADLSEPSGTGTRFGKVVIALAGVAGLIATLITIGYGDNVLPVELRGMSNLTLQICLAASKELPQASPPTIRDTNLDYGAYFLHSIMGQPALPSGRFLD